MSQTNELEHLIAHVGAVKVLFPSATVIINVRSGGCFFHLDHGDRKYGMNPYITHYKHVQEEETNLFCYSSL